METTTAYYTRRAKQQRALGGVSASPEARMVHVELALRFVNLATDLGTWRESLDGLDTVRQGAPLAKALSQADVSKTLVDVFQLPASGAFADLLRAIDESSAQSDQARSGPTVPNPT